MSKHRQEKPIKEKQPARPRNRFKRRRNWTKGPKYSGSLSHLTH